MEQAVRNRLRNVVTQCRRLLEDATAQALQGRFGIYPAGRKDEVHVEDDARMGHLTDEDRALRRDLFDHLEHIKAVGLKPREALEQLVREIAFTHLNRLCAYKMMEARGLIREAVSRGLKSQGFFFYLADHPEDEKLHKTGQQDAAYRNFLDWLGKTLSEEIGVLFNPNDPANRLYPPQRVLDEVLGLINGDDLAGIWTEDETIGWVYQYFTPKELRDKARKESQAPRNSYELAFRNQFYTPRYVVEFLTDNTLGRIWYEMRKGRTALKDRCRYLVRRPTEVFLAEGQEPPGEARQIRDDLSQEELLKQPVYIPHRPKKDPREIRILDPACGSGHFLLYCFDLLQVIYEEAYDDPDLGAAMRKDYPTLDDLRRAVPGLILKHNLHGIDIDLRATQIAALALWLRCQRAYQDLGLKNSERPRITRSNVVCAEPMPGETDLLKEFTATLQPRVLGQLVETIFEKMKLAGEGGSLLKIEEEIRQAARNAKAEFIEWKKHQEKVRGHLFPHMVKRDQPNLLDFADLADEAFLDRVEEGIVEALRRYATQAENGRGFRRRLFADDAGQGFAFIDLCRNRYDTALMNPPFGLFPEYLFSWAQREYEGGHNEIFAAFILSCLSRLVHGGFLGTISSNSVLRGKQLEDLRRHHLIESVSLVCDLGLGVMDEAWVESAAYTLTSCAQDTILFIDVRDCPYKSTEIQGRIRSTLHDSAGVALHARRSFYSTPRNALLYDMSSEHLARIGGATTIDPIVCSARSGMRTFDNERFVRTWWECSNSAIGPDRTWAFFSKGGDFELFLQPLMLVVKWNGDGCELMAKNLQVNGQVAQARQGSVFYFRPGITFPSRSELGFCARVFPAGCIFSSNGPVVIPNEDADSYYLVGLLNASAVRCLIDSQAHARSYSPGLIRRVSWVEPLDVATEAAVRQAAEEASIAKTDLYASEETTPSFMGILVHSRQSDHTSWRRISEAVANRVSETQKSVRKAVDCIDDALSPMYGKAIAVPRVGPVDRLNLTWLPTPEDVVAQEVTYLLGVVFGRWDVRLATGERQPPSLPDPFDPLPFCPPGMLQGPDGLPAKPEDVPPDYPIRIDWDGILVDDPEHPDDIIRRVREVLEVVWQDRGEAIEREACEILGVRELRDYFRKPASGGFWMDHVRRYSKSRRKAPIYWYLRSARGNYGLWLYYHRLDKDILFKALLNYVEPKIRLEEDRLSALRARREAAGKSGRQAKELEKDIDRQEQFVAELHDFRDKLRRAADLHIVPDLNDGVVLNIAPLWELVPWKEAKKYWEELQEGKYDWSHIAYQLWPERVKELCKRDRSVAIAHGLEHLCEAPPPRPKRSATAAEAADEDQQETEEEDVDAEA